MLNPIDFRDLNIGFQNERESLANVTRGWPIRKNGARSKAVLVKSTDTDIVPGMLVLVDDLDEKAFKATSGLLPIVTAETIVGTAAGGTLVDSSTVATTTLVLNGTFDFAAAGVRVGDLITITAPATWNDDRDDGTTPLIASTQTPQTFTIDVVSTVTLTFDSTGLSDPGTTGYTTDASEFGGAGISEEPGDFNGGTITVNRVVDPNRVFFCFDPYLIFGGAHTTPTKKVTILEGGNFEFETDQLDSSFDFLTYEDNNHPIVDVIIIDAAALGGTVLDYTATPATTGNIEINGYDFEANGVAAGDTFTLTAPATWNADRDDGTTAKIASTQDPQTFTIISLSTTNLVFNATTISTPGGTQYDNTTDAELGQGAAEAPGDFDGGSITFNRATADIHVGNPVGAIAGNLSIGSTAVDTAAKVIGHVVGLEPVLNTVKVAPFIQRPYGTT